MELELKNVEPYLEPKYKDLFKLDHLPAHYKRLAWAVFKYCGTKTVPLRIMK
jgi:hypothetical protein